MPRYVVRRLKAERLPYVVKDGRGATSIRGVFREIARALWMGAIVGRFPSKKEAKDYAFMMNEKDLVRRLNESLKS